MNRILELKQQRAAAVKAAADILEKAKNEKRATNAEENAQYDAAMLNAQNLRSTIDREVQQMEVEREIGIQRDEQRQRTGDSVDKQVATANSAFLQWMRKPERMSSEERALMVPGNENAPNFRDEYRAAQTELTGAGGGYLVPQGFIPKVVEALKYYSGMMQSGVTVLNTTSGNDLPMPTEDDTSNMATELGESSPAADAPKTFGQIVFKAFKYTSGIIRVPIELMQDTGIDLEALIVKNFGIRFGRAMNNRFTVGNGSGRPRGITLDAVTGRTGTTGQGAGLVYNDLIGLKYSVNRAYRSMPKTGWMMNDNALQTVLKIVDGNGRPLILDYLATLQAGEPERLLGQPIYNNDDMNDLGTTGSPAVANAAPIIYGDFSAYYVRLVMAIMMLRLVERYAELGQVGFLAFMRWDGRLVDAGTHPVKAYVSPTA